MMQTQLKKKYEKLMEKCLKSALKSKGKNMPNPYVGAIIYDEDEDKIISCGFHKEYGKNHAEKEAIENAKGSTKNKTLIVNLEPCSHYGKTPPCTDLIIQSGFKKAVIAMIDVNPIVSGKGIEKLQQAGIEVIVGVKEKEAKDLNRVFIKNMLQKKPYVMLKTATTLDAKIATSKGQSKWITDITSRKAVQKLRSEYCAVMSGSGTVLADNPRLDVRDKNKKSPIRIIFDPNNKIPPDFLVFKNDGVRKILINNTKREPVKDMEQIGFDGDFDKLFKRLYDLGVYSIMTEAGAGLNSLLLKNQEVDEINHFIAPKIFGNGINFAGGVETENIENAIKLHDIKLYKLQNDILINAKILKSN